MESVIKNRCVIVAAGTVRDIEFLKSNIKISDYVIAADGGYLTLLKTGITPDLTVGDFDSASKPQYSSEIIGLNPIKDCTDTEFACEQAVARGYKNILILGALGGRVDHSFANFALLARFKQKGINIVVKDEKHLIYCLYNEIKTVKKENEYVSIFAFGNECNITLNGFFYNVENFKLTPFDSIGVSNEVVNDEASIKVNFGLCLVIEAKKQ